MTTYESRPASWRVGPVGSPIYSELVTEIAITDEAAGEFVEVRQSGRTDIGKICIDPGEWPALRAAINRAVRACRSCAGSRPWLRHTASPTGSGRAGRNRWK